MYVVPPWIFLVNDRYSIAVAMKKLIGLLILGLIVHQHQVSAYIEEIKQGLQIATFAWDALSMLDAAHDTYNKFSTPSIGEVLEKTDEIIKLLDDQGAHIEEKLEESMEKLLTRLPLMAEIDDDIRSLNTYIVRIDELYADLKSYLEIPNRYAEWETRFLTKAWISRDGDDIQSTIARMFALIAPQRLGKLKKSLFVLLAQESRRNDLSVCDTGGPPQRRLVELFNICMESEKRGFAMYGFGLFIEAYYDKKNYTSDIMRAAEKMEIRAQEYSEILQSTISISTRLFRRCDLPSGHERGITFYEFAKFLQSFVVQESIFRDDRRCFGNCEGYDQPTYAKPGCYGFGCEKGPNSCYGRLTNCENMEKVSLCPSSEARRYEWFEDVKVAKYGDTTSGCIDRLDGAFKLQSCYICRCICAEDDKSGRSNHFISLREQLANVDNNMVVTGVGFLMVDRILHIRIMQGKLGILAEISKSSTSWVELEKIQYDEEKSAFIKISETGDIEDMIEDKDIASLTLENRRFNLDSLSVPPNHIVTGVRFRRHEGNIGLEIRATSFDAETGKLFPDSSKWLTAEDMPYTKVFASEQRVLHKSKGSRNPLASSQTIIDSKPYTFIDVTWSSFEHDAAQTTIPLIDALPLISDPPAALIGVGLYHKARPEYGGFLTFVLEGIDQSLYKMVETS